MTDKYCATFSVSLKQKYSMRSVTRSRVIASLCKSHWTVAGDDRNTSSFIYFNAGRLKLISVCRETEEKVKVPHRVLE